MRVPIPRWRQPANRLLLALAAVLAVVLASPDAVGAHRADARPLRLPNGSATAVLARLRALDRQGVLERRLGIDRAEHARLVAYLEAQRRVPGPAGLPGGINGFGRALAARQDEVSIRTEPVLGQPSRAEPDPDEGPWLRTEATEFVPIKKTVHWRGNSTTVPGLRMSGTFVAETTTRVSIHFAAESCVVEYPASSPPPEDCAGGLDTNRRMFVRALVDGVPVDPDDVVFAVGRREYARSFVFTTAVGAGAHTVDMQWLVDPTGRTESNRVAGFMRDASLLVRQGPVPTGGGIAGRLGVRTAPSGATISKDEAGWSTIPHMVSLVRVPPPGGVVTVTFSGETFTSGDARMAVRARLDGVPMSPADMVFAKGGDPQSRSVHFVREGVAPGAHVVTVDWLRDGQGAIHVGDRSLEAAAARNDSQAPSHPVAFANGALDQTNTNVLFPVPGMTLPIDIPEQGNGEIAVRFSAELVADVGADVAVGLSVDGAFDSASLVTLAGDGGPVQTYTWMFDRKKLAAGAHEVRLLWGLAEPAPGLDAQMGDRSLSVVGETAAMPDLIEPGWLGVGRDRRFDGNGVETSPDHVTGIEPVVGGRDSLVILFDADRPGQPDQNSLNYTLAEMREGIFTGSASTAEYFAVASGGRFVLEEAATLGWFDAALPEATNYWNHPNVCSNGYTSGAVQRPSEAVIQAAANGFPFGDYDRNRDGLLEADELAIMVIYPQSSFSGRARQSVAAPDAACSGAPLVVDGVEIESVADCFGCDKSKYMVVAHEFGHQILGLDDLYTDAAAPATQLRFKALMALRSGGNTTVLNPAYRLYLGWATPRVVEQSGTYEFLDTKLSDRVAILPRYDSAKRDEYFILENRQQDLPTPWDRELGDANGDDSGIGVWQIVEDDEDRLVPPMGVGPGVWTTAFGPAGTVDATAGRQGIRLMRPWTTILGDDLNAIYEVADAFWSSVDYSLDSSPCIPLFFQPNVLIPRENTLTWADCTASGYQIDFLSAPPLFANEADPDSTRMRVRISVP